MIAMAGWPNDALARALARHKETDKYARADDAVPEATGSIRGLKKKAHIQRFAARMVEWAQQKVKTMATEEDKDG